MNTVAEASVLAQNTFSHVSEGDTPYETGGLRDFFLYRDLGIAAATGGQVVAQLVRANMAPETGTGWHRHEACKQWYAVRSCGPCPSRAQTGRTMKMMTMNKTPPLTRPRAQSQPAQNR